jgi:hypothetical protein
VERQLSWNWPEGLCREVDGGDDEELRQVEKLKENVDVSSANNRGNIKILSKEVITT